MGFTGRIIAGVYIHGDEKKYTIKALSDTVKTDMIVKIKRCERNEVEAA